MTQNSAPNTLADVLQIVAGAELIGTRGRDMTSAIRRICEMAGITPAHLATDPPTLRATIAGIRPAAHGVSAKSWSTMRGVFGAALQLAGGIDDLGRGCARRHRGWVPLMRAVARNKRLSNGLAAFANWCSLQDLAPDTVDDAWVQRFLHWLETRSLHPKPRDLVRRVPNVWNEASAMVDFWPKIRLARISYRHPRKRAQWSDISESFRQDAEAYLALRAKPDLFDENAPTRPLARSTLRLQREHIRLAASVFVEKGEVVEGLNDLIQPERVRTVLRHYHNKANGKPCAFAIGVAKTLIAIARHRGALPDHVAALKTIAARLPTVPLDLTLKNKALLRQLQSQRTRARLLFLPDDLQGEVTRDLERGRLRFVEAQVAIAIDILLAVPLRPQNLCSLHWRRHFSEPDGPRGRLMMYIPAEETKGKKQEIVAEIPNEVARRLRWYRRCMLPRLNADLNGFLFVAQGGRVKRQDTITDQIIAAIAKRVGIHMTPHQFRHLGATSYLAANPEDFETVTQMLGHAWSKTSRIYAGVSSQRAIGAYLRVLFEQREAMKFKRPRRTKSY
jgi:integrase